MDTEYLKRVGAGILGAIVALGIVFYLGYHIWHSATREVETQPVTSLSTKKCVEADGYIFRSEVLVYSTVSGGSMVPSVSRGENVRTGGELARVYSYSAPDTVARLSEIEEQISLLENILKGDDSGISLKDSASIDKEIYSALCDLRTAAGKGNALEASSVRSAFLGAVNKREILTGLKSGFDKEIEALENEKASLISKLGSCLQSICASYSGYYYSSADGYEEIFDPALLEGVTYETLEGLLSSAPKSIDAKCAGKTVTSAKWYVVCRTERKYLNVYKAGDTCSVEFKANDRTLEMKIESVLDGGDAAAFVLSTRVMPKDFDYSRVQTVELLEKEYTGLRVPVGAIRVVNGETGVYILDGSTVRFRRISVLYRNEGICIADPDPEGGIGDDSSEDQDGADATPWLKLHDNVITKGKGLYEGRVIGS